MELGCPQCQYGILEFLYYFVNVTVSNPLVSHGFSNVSLAAITLLVQTPIEYIVQISYDIMHKFKGEKDSLSLATN